VKHSDVQRRFLFIIFSIFYKINKSRKITACLMDTFMARNCELLVEAKSYDL
jgi:hypothetical protein